MVDSPINNKGSHNINDNSSNRGEKTGIESLGNTLNDLEKLREYYTDELKRKDAIIDGLLKEREVLLRTAMKQAEKSISSKSSISVKKHFHHP
ncbi:hypothetical protein J4227_07065 [Candidatus Woesearchaeota archaeon]|nr:hypothetical protein [Candidatus Woesearchaeota archaeon]